MSEFKKKKKSILMTDLHQKKGGKEEGINAD